jgi:hypothetical protein
LHWAARLKRVFQISAAGARVEFRRSRKAAKGGESVIRLTIAVACTFALSMSAEAQNRSYPPSEATDLRIHPSTTGTTAAC